MAQIPTPPARLVNTQAGFFTALRSASRIGSFADWLFKLLCSTSALLVVALVLLVVVLLFLQAWPAIRAFGWQTVIGTDWVPSRGRARVRPHNMNQPPTPSTKWLGPPNWSRKRSVRGDRFPMSLVPASQRPEMPMLSRRRRRHSILVDCLLFTDPSSPRCCQCCWPCR